jgi:hypothetical protein
MAFGKSAWVEYVKLPSLTVKAYMNCAQCQRANEMGNLANEMGIFLLLN